MEQLATLYKIADEVVFYRPGIFPEITEDTVCIDVFNSTLSTADAKYNKSLMQALPTARNTTEQVYRNITIAPVIISIVRTELINYENPLEYIQKLNQAISFVQVGLFAEAREYILSLIPDEQLTDEQLNRWAAMLDSADAITIETE